MTAVVNVQESKADEINAVAQGSILGPTLFLFYVNNLPRNIFRSLVIIFADYTTIILYL